MVVCAGSLTIDASFFNLKFAGGFCGHQAADTIQLQSKSSNGAAEQRCQKVYMASKIDCKSIDIVAA